jgi:autotransporter-associated beta strand protein
MGVLAICNSASAAVWTNLVSGNASGNWNNNANWDSGAYPDAQDAVADFSTLNITAASVVTQNVAAGVAVGTLKFADATTASSDWTVISNAIALSAGSGTPTITVTNRTATIKSLLAGSQGFTKTGIGTLVLTNNNTGLSGGVTVANGLLQLNHLGGAGSGAVTLRHHDTTAAGGLAMNVSGTKDVTIDGANVLGTGYSSSILVSNGCSWSGTVTISNYKNNNRFIGFTGGGTAAVINAIILWGINNTVSNITFTGQGSFGGSGNLGSGILAITPVNSPRVVRLASTNWLFGSVSLSTDSSDNKVVMDVENFFRGVQVSFSANNPARGLTLDLNGHNQDIGGLTLSYGFNNPVVTNSSATVATLTLSGSGTYNFTNGAYAGRIGGNLSVVKTGPGTQTLGGTNTYTGDTIISNGVLKLANAAMISNNASICLGPAGVLDVSSVAGGFNIVSNQTLAGAGTVTGHVNLASGGILSPAGTNTTGRLNLSGDATLSDGACYNWNCDGGLNTSDTVRVTGNLTLPASAVVNVSSSGALQANRAALFTYGGTCLRTDFSGWIINPGYKLLNDTEQKCIYVVPPSLSPVILIW